MRSRFPPVGKLLLALLVILAIIGIDFLIDRLDLYQWLIVFPALVGIVIVWRLLRQED